MTGKPETVWGETLDVATEQSNKAAARLRQAGIGAPVRLTERARAHGVSGGAMGQGVIVGWGRHLWTVRVLRHGLKTASSYHVRFWEPVRE